jgi:hypothetical protein
MAFDFSKFKPNIFTTKAKEEIKENITPSVAEEPISFQRYGFRQAGSMNGSIEGLKICLNRVYQEHMADMRRNTIKQEELRKPFKEKLQELLSTKEGLRGQIKTIESEIIPSRKNRIEEIKKNISEIRQHPEHYTGNHVGKVGFYIGVLILILLSIYLFVFYSSASYSALFKEFKISDAQNTDSILTKSIFDSKAISNAWRDGATELILILTIPSVFIGLGYLIHKFQEVKGISKYFKITALLLITFVFDAILAFEITKKIYDLNAGNSFKEMPEYTFRMAFQQPNFWLIIFAGFVVYLIWGFVFDFAMEAYYKLDAVKVHIKEKQNEIDGIEKEINNYEKTVNELKMTIDKNDSEINKLKDIINGTIIQPKEVKEALSQFMVGWYNWLSHGREYSRSDHNKVYEEFITQNVTIIESVINPN